MKLPALINEMSCACGSLNLLYVEDDKHISLSTVQMLSPFFNSITVAYNGVEGLEAYETKKFDIVLTDMMMPVLNGIEMSTKIREINPKQPIIVMSAFESTDNFRQFIEIGISKFIPKPFNFEHLLHSFISTATNINNSKEVVRLTEELERNLKETQAIAKLGNWHLTVDTGDLKWSDEIYELFEIDHALHTPTYEAFLNAIHPDDRELVNTAYTQSIENHTSYNYVHRLLMSDGRIKHVREQGENFYDTDGKLIESRGTVHDITEDILKDENSKESLTRYKILFETSRDALITLSPPLWKITNANQSALTIFGFNSKNEFMEIGLGDISPLTQPNGFISSEQAQHNITVAVNEGSNFFEWEHLRLNGSRFFADVLLTRVQVNEEIYLQATIRDISQRKILEKEILIAKELAERANQTKSDFLSNISHEIRTPLNAVIGLTDLVLQTHLESLQREYLVKSETAAKALLNLLNNVLDYSKIEAKKFTLEKSIFSLQEMVNDVFAMFSYKANEKDLALTYDIDDSIPHNVIGDPLRLQQILINLVVNALKFTESGSVKVCVTSKSHNGHNELTFKIIDTGIGMSEEEVSNLFQPFSQVDSSFTRKYGGTGLGLMISKELIELMGGSLSVQSTPAIGSVFSFTVMLEDVPSCVSNMFPHIQSEVPLLDLPDKAMIHVLLVEDNDLNQLVAGERLKQMGITYSIANNGLEAIDMVKHENFDAILMDLQMPVMDGLEATRHIRKMKDKKDIPIIALSASVLENEVQMARSAGMNDHIAKPINKVVLQNVLAKWLHKAAVE